MAIPPRLREQPKPAVVPVHVECLHCRDSGVIWLAENDCVGGISAQELRQRLNDGRVCLCTCARGQWWLSWLVECRDLYGYPVPVRGVPDNLRMVGLPKEAKRP